MPDETTAPIFLQHPTLPEPRGPLSERVFAALAAPAGSAPLDLVDPSDPEDEAVALFVVQELAYRPFAGVDPAWEDEPRFVVLRSHLERRLEAQLRERAPEQDPSMTLSEAVRDLVREPDGPSLSAWFEEHAGLDHLREMTVHRSAWQLKEADPHTFVLPRLAPGRAKAALIEIQTDEYGETVPDNAHSALFAESMRLLGLDPTAGPDLDRLPAVTLTTNTFLNLLGRTRRLAGACVAHLALFEMTSVEPMARYAAAVRRLLPDETATDAARFFDVHVAADGYHGKLAVDDLLQGLEQEHPELASDAFFGAAALSVIEQDLTEHLLATWTRGVSSLRRPLPGSGLADPGDRAPAAVA